MSLDIFKEENMVTSGWMKFKEIGDSCQGTYIGKSVGKDLNGKDQLIYELLTEEGNTLNVGGKFGIDRQMKSVKLGQIIGFKFLSVAPSKKKGFSGTKIIQVYADPKLVNKEWIAENHSTPAPADTEAPVEGEYEDITLYGSDEDNT